MTNNNTDIIVKSDGTVWRNGVCTCGKTIYKKCLTINLIEFLTGHGGNLQQKIKPQGDANFVTIECPHCGLSHIVGNIKEIIETTDDTTIKKEGVI